MEYHIKLVILICNIFLGGYLGTYKLFKGSLEMRTLPRLVLIGPDWPMAIVLTLTIGLYNLAALVLAYTFYF